MKKYILAFAAVAAMLASCSQDDNLEAVENGTGNNTPQPITTIYASSYDGGTRAAVNGDGTRILWKEGDNIGVISGSKNTPFTLTNGAGTTSGEFSNAQSGITIIDAVMYPYQQDATLDNDKLSFEIPTIQEGVSGSFDKNAAIMYSFDSYDNLQLSLAVNFLKIAIPTSVHSVTISSPSTQFTGKMELKDGNVSTVTGEGCNYVKLIPADGKEYLDAGVYYIAVKPGEIVTPTISYIQAYPPLGIHAFEEVSKISTNNIQFSENNNVVPLKVDFFIGNVTRRIAVQLWEKGPYFATYNVGVTDGKPESYGGYYTWDGDIATKQWGINWRMPTQAELQALLDNCDVEWTEVNGVNGREFTGKVELYKNNNVFLPAAGLDGKDGNGVKYQGIDGRYWSSTIAAHFENNPDDVYCLIFDQGRQIVSYLNDYLGFSVRAVLAE